MKAVPFGSWRSPITSDLITSRAVVLSEVRPDGDHLFWLEMRPAEGGRSVVVRRTGDGEPVDVTPAGFSARTRVHEYGGGAFAASGGSVWFSNLADQRLYRQDFDGAPVAITAALDRRYADAVVDPRRRLLFAVREDHGDQAREAQNTLVRLGLNGEDETVIAAGADFYSDPRLSAAGDRLCWLQWNHPHMPWDGTELWTAELDSRGDSQRPVHVPGASDDAISQPKWSPGGVLHFISDRTGWWNLYRWSAGRAEPVLEMAAEFGSPQWVFGQSDYTFSPDGAIVAAYSDTRGGHLCRIAEGSLRELDVAFTSFRQVRAQGDRVTCLASLSFYSQVFDFVPADDIEVVEIENL